MQPSEAFGVVVRALGLVIWIRGLWILLYAIYTALGIAAPPDHKHENKEYLTGGVLFFVAGAFLIFGADFFVKIAYR